MNLNTIASKLEAVAPKARGGSSRFDWEAASTTVELPAWTVTTGSTKVTLESYVSGGPSLRVYLPVGSDLIGKFGKSADTIKLADLDADTYEGRGRNGGNTMKRYVLKRDGLEIRATGFPEDHPVTTLKVAAPIG